MSTVTESDCGVRLGAAGRRAWPGSVAGDDDVGSLIGNSALRAPALQLLGAAVGGAALQFTPTAAQAQKLKLDLSFGTQVVASTNALRVPTGRADAMLDLLPGMRLKSHSSRLRLDMDLSAVARTYVRGTDVSRIEPQADVKAWASVVDGWVTVDGGISVTNGSTDPFAATLDRGTDLAVGSNRRYAANLTPRLRRELSPEWLLQAADAHSWQRSDDPTESVGSRETTHFEDGMVRIERRPLPLGLSAEVRRQRQFNDAALRDGTVMAIDSVRAGASYRVTPNMVAGVVVGREHSSYLSRDDQDTLYGLNLEWSPNERTWFRGAVEQRFFGQAYDLAFGHRSPTLAVSATLSRQPGIGGTSLGAGTAGASVAGLLDGLLTTRIPNPIDRSTAVNRLITERGLPSKLSQATEFFDQTPQLVRNGAVSLVLLGVRHSVALSLFSRASEELRRDGDLTLGLSAGDFRQRGGSAVLTRRLSPTMTLSLALDRSQTNGLGLSSGDHTDEWRARSDLGVALGPRTQLTIGLGRSLVRSNRVGNYDETRAQVGLMQNF